MATESSRNDGCDGSLVIIGGHENKEWHEEILSTFVALAGGGEAKIVIMTTASQSPSKVGAKYAAVLTKLADSDASILVCDGRAGELEQTAACISQATGVFFVGGEPSCLIPALHGTIVERELHRRYREG